MRKKTVKALVVFILLIIPISLFMIGYIKNVYLKKEYVEMFYKDNPQTFDEIATFFKQNFTESISTIQYDQEKHILEKRYKESYTYSDCSGEKFDIALSQLRDEYQQDSEYKVFSFIRAFFDESGNMLLYLVVKSEKNTEDKIRNYYLVYIDDEYNGHGSELAIDSPKLSTKPFCKNWYYWSKDIQLG